MGFLPVEHDGCGSGVQQFEAVESSEKEGMVSRSSELVDDEGSSAPMTRSRVSDEKMKILHNGTQIILDAVKKYQMKGLRWVLRVICAESCSWL